MAEEVRERTEELECKKRQKMKLESSFKMLLFRKEKNKFLFFGMLGRYTGILTETMKPNVETKNMFTQSTSPIISRGQR